MKPAIRRERVGAPTAGIQLRILFASDLHLGLPWTQKTSANLIEAIEVANPDIVLLGGDLVDNPRGLDAAEACVQEIARRCLVAAVPGNHDVFAGIDEVRRRVVRAGGAWLPDGPVVVPAADGTAIRFCGGPIGAGPAEAFNVACLHDPGDAEAAARNGFALAFAGHLHGGQCVLFERQGRLYPGAWFNRWTGLRFSIGHLRLFVSRGLGDTLPLRLNCPHEVIVCELSGALP